MSQPRSRPVFVTPIDLVLQQQTPLNLQKSPINTSNYSYILSKLLIRRCHKKDVIPRELRKFKEAFQSPTEIRVRLMEELEDLLPATTKFNIGYFCGQSNRWILNAEDIQAMYSSYNPSRDKQLVLWCDGRDDDDNTVTKRRRKVEETCARSKTKWEEKEEEVEELAKELMDLHEYKMQLSETQYRLWARLIVNGIHSSKETPPQISMITGAATPKRQKPTFGETIMNTANAVMKAVSPSPNATVIHSPINHIQQVNSAVSPGKAADIRGKSFEQLATLKQLYADGVLFETEFSEQKDIILSGLKRLK